MSLDELTKMKKDQIKCTRFKNIKEEGTHKNEFQM